MGEKISLFICIRYIIRGFLISLFLVSFTAQAGFPDFGSGKGEMDESKLLESATIPTAAELDSIGASKKNSGPKFPNYQQDKKENVNLAKPPSARKAYHIKTVVPKKKSALPALSIPQTSGQGKGGDIYNYSKKKESHEEIRYKNFDKKGMKQRAKQISRLYKMNYDFQKVPKGYYNRPYTKDNSYLPATPFVSYYVELAFDAVGQNKIDAVRYFIDQYNFTEQRNNITGDTMLIFGVKKNSVSSVRLLLAKGALVNIRNFQGKTALHYAVESGNRTMSRILMTMGGRYDLQDSSGQTAMHLAQSQKHHAIVQMFDSYKLANYSDVLDKSMKK